MKIHQIGSKHKRFAIILIGRLLLAASQLALLRIITELLNPIEAGKYYLISSMLLLFTWILINPVHVYINRQWLDWIISKKVHIGLRNYGLYLLIIMATALIVTITLNQTIGIGFQISSHTLFWIVPLGILSLSVPALMTSIINLQHRPITYVLTSNAEAWGRIAFGTVFAIFFVANAEIFWAGLVVTGVLISLFSTKIMFQKVQDIEKKDIVNFQQNEMNNAFKFIAPIAIGSILYWVHSQSYRFILSELGSAELAGTFIVGFSVGSSMIIFLESLYRTYALPFFYSALNDDSSRTVGAAWQEYFNNFVAILLPTTFFAIAAGSYLGRILIAPQFEVAGIFFLWGTLAESLRAIITASQIGFNGLRKTSKVIVPFTIGAAIILGGPLALYKYNLIYVMGWCIISAYFVMAIIMLLTLSCQFKIKFKWKLWSKSILSSTPIIFFFVLIDNIELNNDIKSSILALLIGLILFMIPIWTIREIFSARRSL